MELNNEKFSCAHKNLTSDCSRSLLGNEDEFHLLSARTNYKVLSDPGLIEYRSARLSLKQDLILHPREISGRRDHRWQK